MNGLVWYFLSRVSFSENLMQKGALQGARIKTFTAAFYSRVTLLDSSNSIVPTAGAFLNDTRIRPYARIRTHMHVRTYVHVSPWLNGGFIYLFKWQAHVRLRLYACVAVAGLCVPRLLLRVYALASSFVGNSCV